MKTTNSSIPKNVQIIKKKVLQNGLLQGSILSPILFNVYTADIIRTNSRKLIYADDIGIVKQGKTFEEIEYNLGKDLAKIQKYLKTWYLILNASKSISIAFHLNNREANYKIMVNVNEEVIPNEDFPRYLGVKLDRALTFKPHLEGLKNKLKTRNNIISKLAGTTWGCKANTLRISAMALVYSAAEYCEPAWTRSTHSKKIDTQLNHTMRIISRTVKSTQIQQWLPALANIAPADLRRKAATHSLLNKI
ncbi:Reverse transcriptase domain [Cinara cedri]|uniref:Reverse transcriptase domain n=1 Tax=Cinara cedri TaxID=506608 RepID=A0A5E4NM92_9HEMI|nr:Reverse transcriptase domain [Cinara cedri]